jgi:hypothetical protein
MAGLLYQAGEYKGRCDGVATAGFAIACVLIGWPKFAALLAPRYVLDQSKNENGIAWRLYLRRAPPA